MIAQQLHNEHYYDNRKQKKQFYGLGGAHFRKNKCKLEIQNVSLLKVVSCKVPFRFEDT